MLIEQIWTGNALRNFNYLIACPTTGEALAIDPLDHQKVLRIAQDKGWEITQILNTHEHGDHTGGNDEVQKATGAKILAHYQADIPNIDLHLRRGDTVNVGSHELVCLDTPGHTMSHICLLSQGDPPALFSGDTLFNAGAGNCHNGGYPDVLYETFAKILAELPDHTLVYPGHEYMVANLKFTLDREPDNQVARDILHEVLEQSPDQPLVTTLGMEKEMNTFFRLQQPEIIARLKKTHFPDLPDNASAKSVFLKLRQLRNHWQG